MLVSLRIICKLILSVAIISLSLETSPGQWLSFEFLIPDIDDCSPNQCQNSATCVDGVDSFSCTCAAGYEGDLCEIGES